MWGSISNRMFNLDRPLGIFLIFFLIHLTLVISHGIGEEFAKIVLGDSNQSHTLALFIGISGIVLVVAFNIWGTQLSLHEPMQAKRFLEKGIDPLRKKLFHHWTSRQNYRKISPYIRVNGRPPQNKKYQKLLQEGFKDFRLEITGLVENPLSYSLEELRKMPKVTYNSLHICIQGWTYYAQWSGVPVSVLLEKCKPKFEAKYLVFRTLDEKWEYTAKGPLKNVENGYYYEVIDLDMAKKPQTILALDLNGEPLPIEYGAPLRLRVESQLGYKMAKWVSSIELVNDYKNIGKGQGGWRDDVLHYFPSDGGI